MDKSVLNKNYMMLDVVASNKLEVLRKIADFAFEQGVVDNADAYYKGLIEREQEVTTGFGDGIAIPHARIKEVIKGALFVAKLREEVEWEALDDKPVQMALAIAMPEDDNANSHLKLLASLSRKLMHKEFVDKLLLSNDKNELYEILGGE